MTRVIRGSSVVDATLDGSEPFSTATPAQRDDLRGDADRGLLRRAGAEVEADGRGEPGELVVGEAGLLEPCHPVVVRTTRAHRADVRDLGPGQSHLEQRHVELRVV